MKITFAIKNKKLAKLEKAIGGKVVAFNLRAGYTCPCAKDCKSKAVFHNDTGRFTIMDDECTKFRCFAASREVMLTNVYYSHLRNEAILNIAKRSYKQAARILSRKIPKNTKAVRIHASGDFATQSYFKAWLTVAAMNPNIVFYGYTKMIPFLIKYKKIIDKLPNFRIVASYGGIHDNLIAQHDLPSAKVVYSKAEAKKLGLPIDKNDSHAYNGTSNFALLIHATQPKGTIAAMAWEILRKVIVNENRKKKNQSISQ